MISTIVITAKRQQALASIVVNRGPKGEDGDDGLSAYQLAVQAGFVGTEADWLAALVGEQGLSAYQVALNNGFVGSESDWLQSLMGSDANVTNTNVNAAISSDAAATRTVLELGNVPNVDATDPANIEQNEGHRFVTDGEKSAWDGKQNALTFGDGVEAALAAYPNWTGGFVQLLEGPTGPTVTLPGLLTVNGSLTASDISLGNGNISTDYGNIATTYGNVSGNAIISAGSVVAGFGIQPGAWTISTLPDASYYTFQQVIVVDALAPVLGSPVSAGGSSACAVRSNGTDWIVTELL